VWLRVNASEDASAKRLQHIVDMDRGNLLPMNTYTALENLRKFYRSADRKDEHIATLKRMIESEYHKPDSYGKLLTALLSRREATARGADFDWIFQRLLLETNSMREPVSYRIIPPRELRELAAKALVVCAQSGDLARTGSALARLRPVLDPWKEAGFVDVFLTPGLTPAQQADRVGAAVDATTADPALLIAAGRLQLRADRPSEAAALFERAVAVHPEAYPATFLSLSQVYFERLLDKPRARDALLRCVAAAPDSPEAREAKRILALMEQQP
jgi:tetratricopeptide (TPR) repeat protein